MKPLDYDIAAIETAFLTALQPLKTSGMLRTLEAYGGQLETVGTKGLPPLLFPAVYVMWAGIQVSEYNRSDGITCGVAVICCDRNLRGVEAVTRGDDASPGVYELLKQVRALVHGKSMDREFYQAQLAREAPLAYDPKQRMALYEALYELRRRT